MKGRAVLPFASSRGRRRSKPRRNGNFTLAALWTGFAITMLVAVASAQNIVEVVSSRTTAPSTNLTPAPINALAFARGPWSVQRTPELQRVAAMLEQQATQIIEGWPWRPLHHTLGISGYEVYFDHPDELFYALSLAFPHLSDSLAARTKRFLRQRLEETPPYAVEGFDRAGGQVRESYTVPKSLRVKGRGRAMSTFGVYAFWSYCHHANDLAAAKSRWPAVQERLAALFASSYYSDLRKKTAGKGEAERLNGDLAGLIGGARLARVNGDGTFERQALDRLRELLEARVNLERTNAAILEPSHAASKSLHNAKLARYCDLVPEVAEALRLHAAGLAAIRLRVFREERPGWYLACGDRMIGGENYTNPLHFSRSLFVGAALVERLPPGQLSRWLDVPWAKADFSFVERCALTLFAAADQPGNQSDTSDRAGGSK